MWLGERETFLPRDPGGPANPAGKSLWGPTAPEAALPVNHSAPWAACSHPRPRRRSVKGKVTAAFYPRWLALGPPQEMEGSLKAPPGSRVTTGQLPPRTAWRAGGGGSP